MTIAGVVAGRVEPEQWDMKARSADFFDIKADIAALFALASAEEEVEYERATHPALRPGRCARILRAGTAIGYCGELHPALTRKWQLTETPMLFELALEPAFAAPVAAYSGISRFPAVRRDIAVIVGQNVPVAKLEQSAREAAGATLRNVVVFDVYMGENIDIGSKSVGLGLILQETSRTLKDADVDSIVQAVMGRLARDFNASIRE